MYRVEEVQERPLETALGSNAQLIAFEQLDVAHVAAGDLDGGIDDLLQDNSQFAGLPETHAQLLQPLHGGELRMKLVLGELRGLILGHLRSPPTRPTEVYSLRAL